MGMNKSDTIMFGARIGQIYDLRTKMQRREQKEGCPGRRIFVDMDGVLCKYHDVSEEELLSKGYFLRLEPEQLVIDAVNHLIELGEDVYILSSVLNANCRKDKNAWLDLHGVNIPPEKRIFPKCGVPKILKVPGGIRSKDILIDDYSQNLKEWNYAGLPAIKILNESNGGGTKFTSGPRVRVTTKYSLDAAIAQL